MKWYRQFDTVCQCNWHDDEIHNRCNMLSLCSSATQRCVLFFFFFCCWLMKCGLSSFCSFHSHRPIGRWAESRFVFKRLSVTFIDNRTQAQARAHFYWHPIGFKYTSNKILVDCFILYIFHYQEKCWYITFGVHNNERTWSINCECFWPKRKKTTKKKHDRTKISRKVYFF